MTDTVQPWEPNPVVRSRLFGIAYRILGMIYDAEDAVQEAFVRWERLEPSAREAIREPD